MEILFVIFAFMSSFSFGYCVVDIFEKRQSEKRINQFMKDLDL